MDDLMIFGEFQEHFPQISDPIIEEKIPFLQMLQCIEPNFTTTESNQILQSLLHIQTLEPKRCLTLETIKKDPAQQVDPEKDPRRENGSPTVKEKRKRKRTRTPKNKDDVENQRMTHIVVERNRRRQMNEHLNSLRSLMPPSFLQRGDQASIVGGAIEFIKELEQLLQSLEENRKTVSSSSSSSHACTNSSSVSCVSTTSEDDGFTARTGGVGETAEVEVTVIQNHVSLKIRCKREKRQILKAIVSIEDLKLTILHLTISSSFDVVFYSFNLKIEDDCNLRSSDEITTAVHQIFEKINGEMIWSNLSRS